uniref:DENN domain-containing protein 1B-like n=1 Tax=Dermatophagoides pteronyssinus TaxID=6956 RepID=A0A6P6XVV5_DERPT|nr:DENN domain-containing protein 1B-like [Dermatophagoides pteronyssinus]
MARIRDEWDRLIELFIEVAIPQSNSNDTNNNNNGDNNTNNGHGDDDDDEEPWILRTYPTDYSNREVLNSVPHFAYPCPFKCDVITHFSFVLTNIKSKWTFGYCRYTPDNNTCLVILSDLPWHSTFYKILDHCAELATRKSRIPLERFLESLYTSDIPQPGLQLTITYTVEDIKLKEFNVPCPDHHKLPSIPEDRNITEYYNAISSNNMIAIFASMLNERRIVMTSERLNRLSACIQAANMLIYPMHWQHIFIPLLPRTLIDYLTAPMPFLIGVPQQTFDRNVRLAELGEIVVLNVDTDQLTTPFDDVSTIPSDVLHHLRKCLKQQQSAALLGDGLNRAFLRALVMLIGSYREALTFAHGQQITFDREAFVSSVRGTSRQLFLENMLQLQIFQQFIESRLDMLNRGERHIDQFEIELNYAEHNGGAAAAANSRFRNQYREWTATMRKEGGAFLRSVNPRVKSALSQGRQAIRQLRQKMANNGSVNGSINHLDRPNSEPSSPKLPPIIKKSISGTFVPTSTSRTVTYVRNPSSQYSTNTNRTAITGTRSISNGQSGIQTKNGYLAPSIASSESSDIEDTDVFTTPPSTLNPSVKHNRAQSEQPMSTTLRQHLECLANQQTTNQESLRTKMTNGYPSDVSNNHLPVPPPRNTTRPTLNLSSSSTSGNDRQQQQPCLIEFDSPPRDLANNDGSIQTSAYKTSSCSNHHLMFDPLLETNNNNNLNSVNHQHDHEPYEHLLMMDSSSVSPSQSSSSTTIQPLHINNSNFYVSSKPPVVPAKSKSTTRSSNGSNSGGGGTSNNNHNRYGWQMFD